MWKSAITGSTVALLALLAGCQPQEDRTETAKPESDLERLSYGMGYNLGSRIKGEIDLDIDTFATGVRDGSSGEQRLMSDEEIVAAMQKFQEQEAAKHEAEMAEASAANLAASEAYLAEHAAKEGVVTTDSGLQYRVIEEGQGDKPGLTDMVEVHYRGTLVDGTEFDSSYGRGEPVTFPVNGVIPGWTEALQLMSEGAKWELVIPADLAYGPGGTGGPIGPNQALIFEVELLDVQSGESEE